MSQHSASGFRFDALATAVAYWVKSMSKDIEEAKAEAKQSTFVDLGC